MNTVRVSLVMGDGLRLLVTELGDSARPTVLFVHGFPDNSGVWHGVAELLADRFHVALFDVRGAGGSEAPGEREGYRLDHLAADIAAVARAVSPDAPVHVVGHDWGSIQGWHAVTDPRYAGRFASYTSISGPCVDHVAAQMRRDLVRLRLRSVLRQMLHSWYIAAFQLPALPELAWRFPLLRKRFSAEVRDAVNGLELYRANLIGVPRARQERRTDVPVQQIELTVDPFVLPPLLRAAEPWCESLWRRSLPVGHWAPRTHPAAVAGLVSEFIEHVGGQPAGRELRGARVVGDARRFAGKLVLVTGAGSGIGRSSALAFAAEGADIIAVDIDDATARATAEEARQFGVDACHRRVDVTDAGALAKLAATLDGVPDIVLANAGIGVAGGFLDTGEDDWRRVLDVNLLGVVHTLRAFAPLLVERGLGGHLVVTASAAAFTPWPVLTAYATTKAAVLSLAQSLRTELAPHGIGVSAICPGLIATNIVNSTRFAGQDAATQSNSRRRLDAAYRRRNYGPDRVAAAVLRAVEDNRAVVPVTPEAHVAALGSRLAPGLVRWVGGRIRTRP
jgi:NAD(P)-dependent dehydrogenase (short-subunit alcohol dehydrogenase family)/pimeloyl-ACP methyl ester carboxylesterase